MRAVDALDDGHKLFDIVANLADDGHIPSAFKVAQHRRN